MIRLYARCYGEGALVWVRGAWHLVRPSSCGALEIEQKGWLLLEEALADLDRMGWQVLM